MAKWLARTEAELAQLDSQSRRRQLRLPQDLDFSGNDYLGMAQHSKLVQSIQTFLAQQGLVGATGSRLLRGHWDAHAELEDFAAQYFSAPAALFVNSGFTGNLALFTALPHRQDIVVFDELVHASVKEGMNAGLAEKIRFKHNDVEDCARALAAAQTKGAHQIWLAVESVYSMDGDLAPLPALIDLAKKYDALLVVDEAHGTGIFGTQGKGCTEGFDHDNMIVLHTCGKALGVAGALITGPRPIIDLLINKARAFVYATALPPMMAHAVQTSLRLIAEEPQRRIRLLERVKEVRNRLSQHLTRWHLLDGGSPILAVVIGSETEALAAAAHLQKNGFDVRAIRPPTVPHGSSRLRITLAFHQTDQEQDSMVQTLLEAESLLAPEAMNR